MNFVLLQDGNTRHRGYGEPGYIKLGLPPPCTETCLVVSCQAQRQILSHSTSPSRRDSKVANDEHAKMSHDN